VAKAWEGRDVDIEDLVIEGLRVISFIPRSAYPVSTAYTPIQLQFILN
jgi:hypothetical protein